MSEEEDLLSGVWIVDPVHHGLVMLLLLLAVLLLLLLAVVVLLMMVMMMPTVQKSFFDWKQKIYYYMKLFLQSKTREIWIFKSWETKNSDQTTLFWTYDKQREKERFYEFNEIEFHVQYFDLKIPKKHFWACPKWQVDKNQYASAKMIPKQLETYALQSF